jgi:uncharacterized membrane protein
MNLLQNKTVIRELVMNIGTITEIGSLYSAFLMGDGRWGLGISVYLICVVINNLINRGWLRLIKDETLS